MPATTPLRDSSLQQRLDAAIAQVKALRYEGENYFWIIDDNAHMIMHPFKPELDGTDASDIKDPNGVRLFSEMTNACAGLRRPGAAALDLADVAAGRLDGFFEQGINAWDVAAGSLLITEAGGLVGNYTGDSEFLHLGEIVAGNPKMYAQMVPILSKYSRTKQQAA